MASQPSQPQKYSFKLVLLGESAVGKSSIVLQFVKGQFDDYRESTIGAAFLTQTVEVEEGKLVKFELWDTAGQERYRSLAPMYYRNAACAVVVYDVTSAPSLTKAQTWIKELQRQADPGIIIALCGNKIDLGEEKRQIKREEAEEFAKREGLVLFECSAKTGQGIAEMFGKIARSLPLTPNNLSTKHRAGLIGSSPSTRGGSGIDLQSGGSKAADGCAC